MEINSFFSHEFAGITYGDIKFSYAKQNENYISVSEFVFKVQIEGHGEVFKMTGGQIRKETKDFTFEEPKDYLLAGIGFYLKEKVNSEVESLPIYKWLIIHPNGSEYCVDGTLYIEEDSIIIIHEGNGETITVAKVPTECTVIRLEKVGNARIWYEKHN